MEVPKVDHITHKEFISQYYQPGIPVVFKNASKVWKANGLMNPDFLRKNFGDKKTMVKEKEYTMSELLDLVENSSAENPAPYPCIFDIPTQLPELIPYLAPLEMKYASPNWFRRKIFPSNIILANNTELFLGSPGGKFPIAHIDFCHTNAWVTQLYGNKDFIVYPRGQDEFMYPQKDLPWNSDVNIFNPDYEKHPKYKNATPIKVTVNAGETIFIPAGIWHSSESLTPSISVIFDQINSKNYSQYVKDVWDVKKKENLPKAIIIRAYYEIARYFCLLGDLFTRYE